MIGAFWDVALISLVGVDRRLRDAYFLHHHHRPDDGGSTHLRNVGLLKRDYTALHLRRLQSSSFRKFLFSFGYIISEARSIHSLTNPPSEKGLEVL
jgi:hypothetical protein